MWNNIDLDEAFRRISLIAIAIWAPIFKLIEFADDHLPTPVVILVFIAPLALAQWFLPTWVYAIPLAILLLSGAWILVHLVALTIGRSRR